MPYFKHLFITCISGFLALIFVMTTAQASTTTVRGMSRYVDPASSNNGIYFQEGIPITNGQAFVDDNGVSLNIDIQNPQDGEQWIWEIVDTIDISKTHDNYL